MQSCDLSQLRAFVTTMVSIVKQFVVAAKSFNLSSNRIYSHTQTIRSFFMFCFFMLTLMKSALYSFWFQTWLLELNPIKKKKMKTICVIPLYMQIQLSIILITKVKKIRVNKFHACSPSCLSQSPVHTVMLQHPWCKQYSHSELNCITG